jgi:septal ring factor EnvC (AmiA/AmiB activator)
MILTQDGKLYSVASKHSISVFTALVILAALLSGAPPQADSGREARLRAIRQEISRLEAELAALGSREQGVLGELERLGTELRLRQAEQREVTIRLERTTEAIESRNERLARLEEAQEQRHLYLTFRLREIYKEGPEQVLKRLVGGAEVEEYWAGLRYAAYLSERDACVIHEYKSSAVSLGEERLALLAEREQLRSLRDELAGAQRRITGARRQRTRLLTEIREDRSKREGAVAELRLAAGALSDLVESLPPGAERPAMDVRKFKGLLDWPADGEVTAGFGTVVHPRFKTRVPHPGLDIEGEAGENIKSVFDGRIVFASWMRGYGLTAIVDHGAGLLSVYAHASALLVETGEAVVRGEMLGKIGDTGSLRGPFLYFELRVDGQPDDPRRWLRPR